MRTSKAEVFLHFVWATKMREPLIPTALERELYRVIQAQVRKLGCDTVAVNGTENHVHLLVKYGRNVTLGRLMNQVKGVSSAFMNDRLRGEISAFRWQPTYGVLGLGANQLEHIRRYVVHQKEHHAHGTTHPLWEETDMDADGDTDEPDA